MHCSLKYYSMFENLFKHWYTFNNNNNRDESETKVELYVSLKKEGKKKKESITLHKFVEFDYF